MTARPRSVVYVIAKAPRPGSSKTRLCPPLTWEQAAALAGGFMLDALDTVRAAGCEPRVMCRDAADRDALVQFLGGRVAVVRQDGSGLGDALESSFRQGLADGFWAVGVFGADSPTLPAGVLRQGFEALATSADVALGQSEDGGYYLLAARQVYPSLFRDLVWSTASVSAITLQRCDALGLHVQRVPDWYDVDDAASLARLCADLRGAPPQVAPHTRAALVAFDPSLAPTDPFADGVPA